MCDRVLAKSDQDMQTEGVEIAIAILTPIEHFDLQIDNFRETISMASDKIVENLLPPVAQSFHESL